MKHKDYWAKRFEQLENAQNSKAQEYYYNLQKQYRQAISDIEKDIAKWYARYANGNNISLTEAKRLLNGRELAEFRMDVNEYIEKGKTLAYSDKWSKQLEAASVRVHVSRLEALKVQMQQQAEAIAASELDGLDKLARTAYTDGYYHTVYEIQKGLGVGRDFMRLDTNKVDKLISKPWAADGKNFSERIWGNRAQLVSELENRLTQSIIRGQSPQKVINEISQRFEVSKSKAGRLIMTETAFFSSAAQKDAFNELGVEQFEIVATLDSRTSETCRHMDGKVIPMQDYKPGVTAPPFHVYCRSTTVPYFEDEFTLDEQRAARDEDNKYYTVPSNMNYGDWQKVYVEKAITPEAWTAQYLFQFKESRLKEAVTSAEAEVTEAQAKYDKVPNTTYSNIWLNDVTLDDWAEKKSKIAAKDQYFDEQIAKATSEADKQKFTDLKAKLREFRINGAKRDKHRKALEAAKAKLEKAKLDLEKHQNGDKIKDNPFSQERKDKALWAKNTKDADSALRAKCGEVWKAASNEEKDAIWEYTNSYSKFNEPLRGIEYGTNKYLGVGNVDMETIGMNYGGYKRGQVKALIDNMTKIIDRSSYDIDVWVQRGVKKDGMEKFLGIDITDFNLPEKELAKKLVGTIPTEHAFTSAAVSKGAGFSSSPIIFNIYAPKGTKMMYAEPFSSFGGGHGRSWNGIAKQSSFGGEAEIILQRGTRFKITKVEKANGKIYIDMDVVEQEKIT